LASANKGDESSVPQQETENIEEATETVCPILALPTSLLALFVFVFLFLFLCIRKKLMARIIFTVIPT
jgi:hypothetical protein